MDIQYNYLQTEFGKKIRIAIFNPYQRGPDPDNDRDAEAFAELYLSANRPIN